MAISRRQKVIFSNTTGDTFVGPVCIQGIKLLAGSSAGTASVADGNGNNLWEGVVAANGAAFDSSIDLEWGAQTFTITLSTGIRIYLYLE